MPSLAEMLYGTYQKYVGNPAAQLVGGGVRGYLGLDVPAYADEIGRKAYQTGQALGNMPGPGAPAGAFKVAAKVVPEAAIFIGAMAKTWDTAAHARAKDLEKAGVDARKIWEETGTWRGPDGKWRQEISDVQSTFKQAEDPYWMRYSQQRMAHGGKIGTVLQHPELGKAYPEALKIPFSEISLNPELPRSGGSYGYGKTGSEISIRAKDPQEARSIALHELQHAIQQSEGFGKGGSPSDFIQSSGTLYGKQLDPAAQRILEAALLPGASMSAAEKEFRQTAAIEEAYRRLAGEAEARAVQQRMNLTKEQRRALFPLESYDVPIQDLIVRFK